VDLGYSGDKSYRHVKPVNGMYIGCLQCSKEPALSAGNKIHELKENSMTKYNTKAKGLYAALILLTIGFLAPALAQESTSAAAEVTMSWQDVLRNGGVIMYVLGFVSILAVAFIVYFFVVLRVSQIAPERLQRDLRETMIGDGLEKARKLCEDRPCPLSAVALAAMDYMRDVGHVDPALLKDVMEGEGSRQSESVQGQTQYLMDIAVVAPMIGLLGTVFGMLRAFGSIAHDFAKAKPVLLAEGVSQALVTTAFGLIVGIPAMMFYAYFRRQSSRMVSDLESASTDLLTALLSRRPQ
jgi:biopolymer transport protein ExbB